jgi:hypothetical protein
MAIYGDLRSQIVATERAASVRQLRLMQLAYRFQSAAASSACTFSDQAFDSIREKQPLTLHRKDVLNRPRSTTQECASLLSYTYDRARRQRDNFLE